MRTKQRKPSDDLFEILADEVGCDYISDMKYEPYNTMAKSLMANRTIEQYSLSILNDIAEYLYRGNYHFISIEQAHEFFQANINIQK